MVVKLFRMFNACLKVSILLESMCDFPPFFFSMMTLAKILTQNNTEQLAWL